MKSMLGFGALALLSGAFLRLGEEYGVPALRMLGFWSLAGAGLFAAREIGQRQVAEGRSRFQGVIAGLGAGQKVEWVEPGRVALLHSPERVLVLVADGMAAYGNSLLSRMRFRNAIEKARAIAESYRRSQPDREVVPVLVLLRRDARNLWKNANVTENVMVINPEDIPGILQMQ